MRSWTRCPDLQSLVRLEVDGFRIGRNVQSLVLRQFRVGRLDDADPRHRDAAVKTLARSLATKQFMQRLLAERRPDIAVFVERGYTPSGEVFDGCLLGGVDTIQWCGAPQSDCLIYRRYGLDTRGEHPLALSDPMWRRLNAMPWSAQEDQAVADRIAANYKSGAWYNRQQLQDGKAILAADEVRRTLGLDPSRRTAVVFSHILYDATFFYGDNLFDDYEQWLVETVRAAIANPRLNWIVKVHPVNVWRARMDGAEPVQLEAQTLDRHFGALPDHVKLMPADTPINTFSLFDVADYGLTVRGTIGMELPCFGIPVVTAGTGRYSGRGFTIEPTTRGGLRGRAGAAAGRAAARCRGGPAGPPALLRRAQSASGADAVLHVRLSCRQDPRPASATMSCCNAAPTKRCSSRGSGPADQVDHRDQGARVARARFSAMCRRGH